MTAETTPLAATARLSELNRELVNTRAAFWSAGNHDAAFALDSARNSIAQAMHDLRRADVGLASGEIASVGTLLVDKVNTLTKATPAQYEAAKLHGRMVADQKDAAAGWLMFNGGDLEYAAVMRDAWLAERGLY